MLLSPLAGASVSPTKSPNDPNEYRFLELDNGLRVILASDPDADKAAASMNVAVGSGNDPADREGLAHFLEHMLFLGTEKYPDPGEYQQFIRSHGGSHNAFTAFA
ncbi:MAG: insulinase family protein, partial [Marinobacter sp.]